MDKIPYMEALKTVAPSIAIGVRRERDESFRWDGDGPDPEEKGLFAYDVIVAASVIIAGEIVRNEASLGGSYYEPDEPIGEAHGYLPQMVEEAIKDLMKRPLDEAIIRQCKCALALIKGVLDEKYDRAMRERAA